MNICPQPCPFENPLAIYSLGINRKITPSTGIFLSKSNIKFINDIVSFNSTSLLTWEELPSRSGIIRPGAPPKWFSHINNPGIVGQKRAIPNPSTKIWHIDEAPGNFIFTNNKKQSLPLIKGHHKIIIEKTLKPCSCPSLPCFKSININSLTSCWYIKRGDGSYQIINPLDELCQPKSIPPDERINISIIQPNIFPTSQLSLKVLVSKNKIIFDHGPITLYKTKFHNSTAFIIFLLNIIIPLGKTSSITIISNYSKPKQSPYCNKWFNTDNGFLIHKWFQSIKEKAILVTFKKLSTHDKKNLESLSTYDEIVDWDNSLSKTTYNSTLNFMGSIIPNNKDWMTSIVSKEYELDLLTSRQISQTAAKRLILANKELLKTEKYQTTNLLAFRCKILDKTLPTRSLLNNRYPSLYPSHLCPACNLVEENLIHITKCDSLKLHNSKISNFLNALLEKNNIHLKFHINDLYHLLLASSPLLNLIPSNIQTQILNITLKKFFFDVWSLRSNIANNAINGIKWSPLSLNNNNNNNKNNNIKSNNININSNNSLSPDITNTIAIQFKNSSMITNINITL
jgi:hypothetical protein